MVDKGRKLAAFTDNTIRWKVLTWWTDSSHGRGNAVVRQDYNYPRLQLHQSKDPFSVSSDEWHYYKYSLMISQPVIFQRKKHYEPKLFHCNQPWWVSHLRLIKNSNIHFFKELPVWSVPHPWSWTAPGECFFPPVCYIIGLSNIYRAPFNNCISLTGFVFCLSTYSISISAALVLILLQERLQW